MNETVKNIIERASPRKFKPEHIPAEDLELIVQAGLKAPSAKNLQTPRFLVIKNAEVIGRLSKMNADMMGAVGVDPFYAAPDLVVVLALRGPNGDFDGSLAVGNMLNAAYAMGYGGRWINRCREMFNSEQGKQFLKEYGIEEDLQGIACVIFGYPDEDFAAKPVIGNRVYHID